MLTWPQPTKGYRLDSLSVSKDYDTIEKMLLFHRDDIVKDTRIIEQIYGLALFRSNERIISLVNLFVRENKIEINRYNVLDSIYLGLIFQNEERVREQAKGCRSRQDECNYASFNELKKLQLEYIHKYWNMFEVKNY